MTSTPAGTEPAGIVYHATESHIVEFKAGRNHALQAASLGLLDYVRRRRSYHFVVDRFGRVHRVVLESDAADHAGWSVWADRDRVYLNLNDSFLAIALETRNDGTGALPPVTAAQWPPCRGNTPASPGPTIRLPTICTRGGSMRATSEASDPGRSRSYFLNAGLYSLV